MIDRAISSLVNASNAPGRGALACTLVDTSEAQAMQSVLQKVDDRTLQHPCAAVAGGDEQGPVRLEALGLMTAGIAHDLGNIIQILSSTVELLDQHPTIRTTMSLQRPMRRAASSVARATSLIAQILRFARGSTAEHENVQLQKCLTDLKPLLLWIGNNTVRLDVRVEADAPLVVCNRSHLENAILNLALNARDAMPKGGTLTIAASSRCALDSGVPGLELSISDDGIGMARETMERAFDPFFTTKAGGRGAGLGLAMVRRFAEEIGGTVSLQSTLGLGTTVTLWLPLGSRPRTEGGIIGQPFQVERSAAESCS